MSVILKENLETMNRLAVCAVRGALFAALIAVAADARAQDTPLQNDILGARVNTLLGASGLITVPDAYTGAKNRAVVGAFFGKNSSVSANYGILQGVDLGIAQLDMDGSSSKTLLNAKVNLVPANFKGFQLGAGIIDAADQVNTTVYGIASFEYRVPDAVADRFVGMRVHAGFGSGIYRDKIIGGVELLVNNRTSIVGDYNGTKANVAVRFINDDALRFQAGLENKNLFFGINYALGAR